MLDATLHCKLCGHARPHLNLITSTAAGKDINTGCPDCEIKCKGVTIHVTERTAFKTCRQYWDFSYNSGLVPLQRHVGGPMWLGVGIHFALASYYKDAAHPVIVFDEWYKRQTADVWGSLTQEQADKLEETHVLGLTMLTNYLPYARENDNWDVLGVEKELHYEIEPGIIVAGTLDLLVRRRETNRLYVVDHKTALSFIDPEALVFDDQMVVYLWLVWKVLNEVPAGALYSMLRKKIPMDPLVLKSGKGISKAQNIDTTYDKYYAAIVDNGFDPSDYVDVLERVKGNEFFRREEIGRTRRELALLDNQILMEAREMTRQSVPIFPTMTHDCLTSCQFRDLCRTRTTGGDVAFMMQTMFKQVTDYDARWLETHPRETGQG